MIYISDGELGNQNYSPKDIKKKFLATMKAFTIYGSHSISVSNLGTIRIPLSTPCILADPVKELYLCSRPKPYLNLLFQLSFRLEYKKLT
jgi:hypothetical protein